jgi:hypothetical protein
MIRRFLQSVLCLLTLCLIHPPLLPTQTPPPSNRTQDNQIGPVALKKGTEVRLVLLETVSSATVRNGQTVRMAVALDVTSNGVIVIPKGTPATGEITQLRKAVPKERDGHFEIKPMDLTLPGGAHVKLHEYPPDACEPDGPCWLLKALAMPLYPLFLIHDAAERRDYPEEGKEFVEQECSPESGFLAAKLSVQRTNLDSSDQTLPAGTASLAACMAEGRYKDRY